MFCTDCGKKVDPNAVVCVNCGVSLKNNASGEEDKPSTGLNIVSFLIPLVGLILYLSYKDNMPNKAKKCGKWALIGLGISIGLSIFSGVLTAIVAAGSASFY